MWDNLVYIVYVILACLFWNRIFNTPDFVKYYAKFVFYVISMQILAIFIIPIMALRPRSLHNAYLFARITRHVTKVLGVTWHYRNEGILSEKTPAVIICNHQSCLDLIGMCHQCYIAKKTATVCKKEIVYFLPFGLIPYLTGSVIIDRNTPETAHKILKTSADELFKKKAKIFLFPEGTRNKDRGTMQPFKKGAFRLAIDCQVPIIPVVMSPYYFLDAKKKIFNKGHMIVQCLDAVPTTGLTMDDLPELKDRVQNMMVTTYEQLGKEIANTSQEN